MDKNNLLWGCVAKVLLIWNYCACYNNAMAPSCILLKIYILKGKESQC